MLIILVLVEGIPLVVVLVLRSLLKWPRSIHAYMLPNKRDTVLKALSCFSFWLYLIEPFSSLLGTSLGNLFSLMIASNYTILPS